jgi:hypothetical protein
MTSNVTFITQATSSEIERRLRRLAIELAGQLPEDSAEALKVLEYTADLLVSFIDCRGAPAAKLGWDND